MRSVYGIDRYVNETMRLYSVLEHRLKESPYLAGDQYTIADIANFAWVRSAPMALEIDLVKWPALKKWVDEIEKREAVQKGVDVPQLNRSFELREQFFKDCRARIDGMMNLDEH